VSVGPRYSFLIIDMLNDFFDRSASLSRQRNRLVACINELGRAFRTHQHQVLWVRQEFRPDLKDAFLEMRRNDIHVNIAGTEGCLLLPELEQSTDDRCIVKKRYSAFFETGLDDVLSEVGTEILVVGGINTHACVRTTVIDAYQRDFDVIVASECIGSHDLEHHEVTTRYLDGKMARFMSNRGVIELIGANADAAPAR
jgi:nicotinamidase-related amidase